MPAYIGPGPNNPLGTRAMNLSIGGIRIHGTPDSGSIGGPASHGCIRMYMHDAEELFDIIDVGTPVLIVGG
jgi:lipoprotein-anchoring transpeptidase ErfK/SrfK